MWNINDLLSWKGEPKDSKGTCKSISRKNKLTTPLLKTNRQTTVNKTQHRELKIEKKKHLKLRVISCAPEG